MLLTTLLCTALAQIHFASSDDNNRLQGNTTNDLTVTVKQGALQGQQETTSDGTVYYSFKGIPYAKPPLGSLRFKSPEPPESWDEIRNATEYGSKCLQQGAAVNTTTGSEDCLYLNVYTLQSPDEIGSNVKPVMFWIHGGSYNSGSGQDYGPDYIIKEDVVLVTMNYRLGALGFLRVDDPTVGIPGNLGLKDMVVALEWVQENIGEFGGDHSNVTIFGESAGGSSVHLLTLSPLAEGLFHKVIIESASALSTWALVQPDAKPLQELAQALGISEDDDKLIVEELEKMSGQEIVLGQLNIKYTIGDSFNFAPTVEKPSNYTPFLGDNPLNIIRSGNFSKVPIIIGYNSREGILLVLAGQALLNLTVEDMVPSDLNLTRGSEKFNEVAEKIRQFYYDGGNPSIENINIVFTASTDTSYWVGIHRTIVEQMKVSPENVYLYRFSVDSKYNYMKYLLGVNYPGACHADELGYLFKMEGGPPFPIIPQSVEDLTIKRLSLLWTNFAKYGNPNPKNQSDLIKIEWKPVQEGEFNYIEIGENLANGVDPDWNRILFWDDIYESTNK